MGGHNECPHWIALTRLDRYGIRVNVLPPGVIFTDLNPDLFATLESCPGRATKVPLGRLGMPQGLVGAAIFLASGECAFLTGIVLPVDGGEPIW